MKKILASILVTSLLTTSLAGCGGSTTPDASSTPNATADPITLTMSHQLPAANSIHESSLYFAETVKELSNGELIIDVFETGTLGTESQNMEALSAGTLDLAIIAVEFYGNTVPDVGALILPYLYDDYDQVREAMRGPGGDIGKEAILESSDVLVLDYYVQAFRQIFTKDHAINTVEDLAGLKIRVPESNLYVNTFKLLGAAPTPLAFGEMYTAVDTGVVNGLENTPESILSASLDEVTTHVNMSSHINAPTTISISNKVFTELSEAHQAILLEAAVMATDFGFEKTVANDLTAREELAETLTVVEVDIDSIRGAIDYDTFDCMQGEMAKEILAAVTAD